MTPIVAGQRRYGKTPHPPADVARTAVTFAEIFAEAQNESGRHAIARDDLLCRANNSSLPPEAINELRDYAETRARLVEVYDAIMKLTERCADKQVLARLKVLSHEAAARAAIDAPKQQKSEPEKEAE